MSYFGASVGVRPAKPEPDAPAPVKPEPVREERASLFAATPGARPVAETEMPEVQSSPLPPLVTQPPTREAASPAPSPATGMVYASPPPPDAATIQAAIDRALRRNSARLSVNGLFDLE
jgi:hypothetical protein